MLVLILVGVTVAAAAAWLLARNRDNAVMPRAEPLSPFVQAMMAGEAAFFADDFSQAITEYSRAVQADPKSADAYFRRGSAYLKSIELDSANRDFDEALRLDPGFYLALANRAVVALAQRNLPAARRDLDQAIRINPKYAPLYASRSALCALMDQHDEALADAKIALQLDPKNREALQWRGEAYMGLKQPELALKDALELLKQNPTDRPALSLAGRARIQLGDYRGAMDYVNRAIALGGDRDDYQLRGQANMGLAQWDAALADFDKVLELAPENHPMNGWVSDQRAICLQRLRRVGSADLTQ